MAITTETTNMPFHVKDCTLITRMGGVETAINLRELRDRIQNCPESCLFHHFAETQIRPYFDDPEFRNDFAIWSARILRDRVLAERLGILNPYKFDSLQQLREALLDILDERLSELPFVPSVPKGDDFIFMQAATVVFETDIFFETPDDLVRKLPLLSHSSLYYHFIEARRRTKNKTDDFSAWLEDFGKGCDDLRHAFRIIDFYYLTLQDLRTVLIDAVRPFQNGACDD